MTGIQCPVPAAERPDQIVHGGQSQGTGARLDALRYGTSKARTSGVRGGGCSNSSMLLRSLISDPHAGREGEGADLPHVGSRVSAELILLSPVAQESYQMALNVASN